MTKTSRELALTRAALVELLGGTVKLVEFTQTDGDKVSINPDSVKSVEERGPNTLIVISDKVSHTVTESFADVVVALEGGA